METIIITTDFSTAALNAARYAAAWSEPLEIKNIVLYHSYEGAPVSSEVPLPEPSDAAFDHEKSLAALEALEAEIRPLISVHTKIDLVANDLPLILGVDRLQEQRHARLVVVGMTGRSIDRFFVGSNTLNLAQTSATNLLIVPPSATYTPIEKAVFACDFDQVDKTIPTTMIAEVIHQLHAELLILNVAKPKAKFDPDIIPEQFKLHDTLESLEPAYHYTEHQDIAGGIMEFAEAKHAQLVITVPKPHGPFENLLHRSVTKKLSHHTRLPVLLLK